MIYMQYVTDRTLQAFHDVESTFSQARRVVWIGNGSHSFSEQLQLLAVRTRDLAFMTFDKIVAFLHTLNNAIKEFSVTHLGYQPGEKPQVGFFETILTDVKKDCSSSKEATKGNEAPVIFPSKETTLAYEQIKWIVIPVLVAMNPALGCSGAAAVTGALDGVTDIALGDQVDQKVIRERGMVNDTRPGAQILMKYAAIVTGVALATITGQQAAQAAVSLAISIPAVQKLVRNSFVFGKVEEGCDLVLSLVKDKILQHIVMPEILEEAGRMQPQCNKMEGQIIQSIETNSFAQAAFVSLRSKVTGALPQVISHTIKILNDETVDFAVRIIGKGLEHGVLIPVDALFMNTVLCNSASPVVAAMGLIAGGGGEQSVRDLTFRVAGVAVMLVSGSAVLPIVITYTPVAFDFFMRTQGLERKKGWVDMPAMVFIKKVLADWNKEKEVIKVSQPIVYVGQIVINPERERAYKDLEPVKPQSPVEWYAQNVKYKPPSRFGGVSHQPGVGLAGVVPLADKRKVGLASLFDAV